MYEYQATVIRVVDGDTVDLNVDLGLNTFTKERVRLYGINAPEKNTPQGPLSTARLKELLPVGIGVTITTFKDKKEKYGRYLAVITFPGRDRSINQQMVDEHFAVPYLP